MLKKLFIILVLSGCVSKPLSYENKIEKLFKDQYSVKSLSPDQKDSLYRRIKGSEEVTSEGWGNIIHKYLFLYWKLNDIDLLDELLIEDETIQLKQYLFDLSFKIDSAEDLYIIEFADRQAEEIIINKMPKFFIEKCNSKFSDRIQNSKDKCMDALPDFLLFLNYLEKSVIKDQTI